MNKYSFTIPIVGTEKFEIEANSPEEAAKILANTQSQNDFLVESEFDWDLGFLGDRESGILIYLD